MRIRWTKAYTYMLLGIIISTIAIFGISFITIIKPLQNQVNILEQESKMFQKQYDLLIDQHINGTDNEMSSELQGRIPNEKAPDTVLESLDKLSKQYNVSISSLRSNGKTVENDENSILQSNTYSMDVEATNISQLNSFIDAMEESGRYMIIRTLSLYQSEQGSTLSITFETFHTNF